ncbi:MAG: CapA family protein [Prevotella sp.]|nr:CapA family protein [Prevotella sp.]
MKSCSIALAASLLVVSSCSSSPPAAEEEQLSILFTGDVLLDRGVRPMTEHRGVAWLFDSVQTAFRQADAVVINLECPLTDTLSPVNKRYIFRADARWAEELRRAGITHAAMANNHTNDQGRRGLLATYTHLSEAGITPLGFGTSYQQQSAPVILQKGKTRAALFNAAMMTLENWHYVEGKPGICQPTASQLVQTVAAYRAQHPETAIVAVLHWGVEFNSMPSLSQRMLARQLADAGADAIIGHHPHVTQPVDTIGHTLVCYSLGNFVFDQHPPLTRQCIMVRLNVKAGKHVTYDIIPAKIEGNRPMPVPR